MPTVFNVCLIPFVLGIFFIMKKDFYSEASTLKEEFYGTSDLIARTVKAGKSDGKLFFLDAMSDGKQLELSVIAPLNQYKGEPIADAETLAGVITAGCGIKETENKDDAVKAVSAGDAVLILEGSEKYFLLGVRKGISRAVSEPPTGTVVKGPREGFVEDIKTNMVLLRRRIRSNKLVFKSMTEGRFTETTVMLCYVEGIVKQGILEKVTERLNAIDSEGFLDSSAVTKILEARPYSVFKQLGNTEKPDVAAAKLLDGRVVVLVDGSPIAITVPFLLIEDFEDAQDQYKRSSRVTFLRLMRAIAVIFAVILPALYVAIQVHQYQILPLQLLITLLNSTEGIPFSPTLEMLIALLLFEILSEASIRMPRHIGMALGVVGAIVLGDTAVQAGLLSSLTVLTVAMSGIGIYAVPDEVGVLSVLRMCLVVVGGLFGMFGLLASVLVILVYLSCMETYNVPYLAPFAPIENEKLRETLLMPNFTDKKFRTPSMQLKNKRRIINNLPR